MAKVSAPLLSMSARGQIGKSIVMGSWRGVKYARQHVTPSNPRTEAQTATRGVFAALDETYKRLGPLSRAPWDAEVDRRPLTPRNAFIRANLPPLRQADDMTGWIGSMGARSGMPITSLNATEGAASGEIDLTIGVPQAPNGWTIDAVVAHAVHDRMPSNLPTTFVVEMEQESPTPDSEASLTLTGMIAGDSYVCSAWLRWTRPDGRTAFGASLTSDIVTAAA